MHRLLKFYWILLLTPIHFAFAYDSFSEYESLTELEQETIESPSRLPPEYQSDLLTYSKPFDWHYDFLSHDRAFDFTLGSISASHFYEDLRLKVSGYLTETLNVKLISFANRDRELDSVHTILEIGNWFTPFFALQLYIEPSLYKKEDDAGLALVFKLGAFHELRLYNTWVDVSRNKRNPDLDTFEHPYLPHSRGFVGRLWSDPTLNSKEFLEYYLRFETRTKWIFPLQNYIYEYEKLAAGLMVSKNILSNFDLQFQMDHSKKQEDWQVAQSHNSESKKWILTLRALNQKIGPTSDWELTSGLQYAFRDWTIDSGSLKRTDILPHLWLKIPAFLNSESLNDHLKLGYEFLLHDSIEEGVILVDPDETGHETDHRLNLGYEIKFRSNSSFVLLATIDLDRFGTNQTWQGGNGQFRYYF